MVSCMKLIRIRRTVLLISRCTKKRSRELPQEEIPETAAWENGGRQEDISDFLIQNRIPEIIKTYKELPM